MKQDAAYKIKRQYVGLLERQSLTYTPLPAYLIAPSGLHYIFTGGYGDDNRRPTQEGCALIADYLDAQGLIETRLTLTATLDVARAWHDAGGGR